MSDLANKTVTVNVSDLDTLANLILEIDESKGNNAIQQAYISMAHNKIASMLGKHAHLVYPPQEKI